jgi:PAS domain-containing protein
MLYEVLCGRAPFEGSSTREVLRRVCEEEPVTPHEVWSDVPPALEAACIRAMSKRPADRHSSASELAQEVQNWQDVERRRAEEQRDTFFQLSIDMLCTAGFDGYFKRLNSAWEKALGYTTQELFARPFLDFIHPEDRLATMSPGLRTVIGVRMAPIAGYSGWQNLCPHRD